jgi:hypothetical protein
MILSSPDQPQTAPEISHAALFVFIAAESNTGTVSLQQKPVPADGPAHASVARSNQ